MAGRVIYVEPQNMWAHFQSHLCYVGGGTSELVAEYPDYGVEIYLYSRDLGEKCVPEFDVMMDGDIVHVETTYTEVTTNQTAKKIFDKYLDPQELIDVSYALVNKEQEAEEKAAAAASTPDDDDDDDTEMLSPLIEIEERESELAESFAEFLKMAVWNSLGKNADNKVFRDTLEHTLSYLYQHHGIDIYRPMVIEYADGSEEYTEYPYDSLALDTI